MRLERCVWKVAMATVPNYARRWNRAFVVPITATAAFAPPERDRLGRFFPALLAITLVAATLEIAFAIVLGQQGLATAALATAFFAVGVTLAGFQIRAGRPVKARVALATTLTLFGGIGAFLVPGVGQSLALLPIVAVVLVLPYVERGRMIPIAAAAVAASVLILGIDGAASGPPAIPGIAGVIFNDAIQVAVMLLVLAGLADFATQARDSLRDLRASTEEHLQVTTSRLSIVSALRVLQPQVTPEATAQSIANALSDLPLVDVAAILEVSSAGEASVIALAGSANSPIQLGERLPPGRAEYVIARSRQGAWAESWAARAISTLDVRLAEVGLKAQAFAPILSGDVIVGLVIIGTTDQVQALHLVADLPSVSEAAGVADTILGPALMARRWTGEARVQIAQVITSRAFHPEFQPIVDLRTGRTVGFEALTRFAGGQPPDRVFSDAAKAGIGAELEGATMRAAVGEGALLPRDAWLSLNVSPSFLGAYAELAGILADRGRPIMLEVTEHEVIDDYARLHSAMRALGPGVRLAVDDAGAGVANFRHLVDLRPNLIKIDAGMIRGVEADVSRQALIVGLVHFAEVTGAQVLAEGLETRSELDTVVRLGVTLGQGFLLAHPAPVSWWIEAPPPVAPRPGLLLTAPTAAALPN
jgi:EAL domain-containing protein (putative c-di-GMP-specific phosphodiesterase class I)